MMDNIEKRSNDIPWFIILPLICLFIIFTLFYSGISAYPGKKAEEKKAAAEMKKVLTSYIEFAENRNDVKIDMDVKASGGSGS